MTCYLSVLKQVPHSVCARIGSLTYAIQEQVGNKASMWNDTRTSEHARNSQVRCFRRQQEEYLVKTSGSLTRVLGL